VNSTAIRYAEHASVVHTGLSAADGVPFAFATAAVRVAFPSGVKALLRVSDCKITSFVASSP
jgi:hypothetical protein